MVYVVCRKDRIIGQTKSEEAVFEGEHIVRITKSERCRPQLNVEGYALQRTSTSLVNSRPSNDMGIDHRNIERRHKDIFIRYRIEPSIWTSSVTLFDAQKGGYVHSSINNSRRPIPKNGPIRLDRCRCLVDDVFKDGVGSVELRYPGYELYFTFQFISPHAHDSKMDGRTQNQNQNQTSPEVHQRSYPLQNYYWGLPLDRVIPK